MSHNFGPVSVEEHLHGGTQWVALRARGAEWSWLTPQDAVLLARYWLATYGVVADNPPAEGATSSRG